MFFRVLVTGGRDYGDYARFEVAMEEIIRDAGDREIVIVQGGARGLDRIAHEWALAHEFPSITVPARWSVERNAAGAIRNQRMLDQHGPFDLVVVFPGGNGTADMRRRAEAANLIIRVVQ